MAGLELHIAATSSQLSSWVCDFVVAKGNKAVQDHGFFSLGLSGGSVATIVSEGLRARKDIDWGKWHVFYCDERYVPFSSEDSTHAYVQRELLNHVSILESNVYAINPALDLTAAAEDYVAKIRKLYPGEGFPSFDLLLLGMGPDGHTCSLFPGHPGLLETTRVVIPIENSPKPPPSRITLTLPVLNNATSVAVISTGSGKADAVRRCLEPSKGEDVLPAGLVSPSKGELHWFLDEGAAAKLTKK